MLVFYLILFLTLWKKLVCLQCIYTEEPMEFLFVNYTSEYLENLINTYPNYDYTNDNINMCRVEIFIDYQEHSVAISFADSFQWSQIDDGEARLDFLIVLNKTATKSDYLNVLEYACNDNDQCDKTFVLNHIDWLLNVNYSTFEIQLKNLLLTNSTKTERCFSDKTNTIPCPDGICMGKYSTFYHNYYFECHDISDASVEIHITTTMMLMESTIEKSQMIRYTCKFNQCNNQQLSDSLINIINIYYSLNEMEDALSPIYSIPSNRNQTTLLTTDLTTTLKTMNNNGLKINSIKKYFLILINLIFYFI